jgi:sulfide:quinone oxidoreductase
VSFFTALPSIFGAPKYAGRLMEIVKSSDIGTFFRHNLVQVDGDKRIATFEQLDNSKTIEVPVKTAN